MGDPSRMQRFKWWLEWVWYCHLLRQHQRYAVSRICWVCGDGAQEVDNAIES